MNGIGTLKPYHWGPWTLKKLYGVNVRSFELVFAFVFWPYTISSYSGPEGLEFGV